ncbi:MAG: Na(+)-translocating NADH-quinone reductase subunit C [Bacteroidetes bacterium]|nr:Na(+)-translocating NADH-quinone reductase subunit C [Bacteroidota bacterium]MBU1678056.1 Na(+)-translocating NADH-quinone reductase subunit C [Bacteroidota bacterium]MBU2506346.1 Na(+)-translocating NADH-quinone reductase subunit C [Bacteroidota bacterium]
MSSDSTKKTIIVALGVCLVCSVFVATATVSLTPRQNENKKLDKIQNILLAGDIDYSKGNPEEIYFDRIKSAIVEIETGKFITEYNDMLNPDSYDMKKLLGNPDYSAKIAPDKDLAGIKIKPKYMIIYEVMSKTKEVEKYILPIYGKGLWSTMYGFIALDKDLSKVKGFTFYQHGETPGLGGEVDNPKWKEIWKNKEVFDANGNPVIQVIKGRVDDTDPNAIHKIDGLSGSTLTTRGVDNTVKFWLGDEGYGPFFKRVKSEVNDEKI